MRVFLFGSVRPRWRRKGCDAPPTKMALRVSPLRNLFDAQEKTNSHGKWAGIEAPTLLRIHVWCEKECDTSGKDLQTSI